MLHKRGSNKYKRNSFTVGVSFLFMGSDSLRLGQTQYRQATAEKYVSIAPEMQHWRESLLSLSKSSSWREWGSKSSKTVFALWFCHPNFFQPFSVLGHRAEGCLWGWIPGPTRWPLWIPGGGTGVTSVVTCMFDGTGLGWLQNLHCHHEFMVCSSANEFHSKSGSLYIQHCFTGVSGAIPGTRYQAQNGFLQSSCFFQSICIIHWRPPNLPSLEP